MMKASVLRAVRTAYHHAAERRLTERDRRARHWVSVLDGDHTYRLDYPLDAQSVVMDVGGYKGQYASDIFGRFCCTIHVYEPVMQFAHDMERRFARNPNIHVHDFGLAASTRREQIDVRGDETSALGAPRGGNASVQLRAVVDEVQRLGSIDLMKLNIEGLEYELLEALLDSGGVTTIRYLQVQFHDFVPAASARRDALRDRLRSTHDLAWDFPFVWESWTLRTET